MLRRERFALLSVFFFAWLQAAAAADGVVPASSIPAAALLQPQDLAATLQATAAPKPLILQVGFRTLYDQAHIPGADYVAAAKDAAGVAQLQSRVAGLAKDTAIVLYCGCCPWGHCPNVGAAYGTLHSLGFTRVKVLFIANDFGTDWVDKGYPAVHGP